MMSLLPEFRKFLRRVRKIDRICGSVRPAPCAASTAMRYAQYQCQVRVLHAAMLHLLIAAPAGRCVKYCSSAPTSGGSGGRGRRRRLGREGGWGSRGGAAVDVYNARRTLPFEANIPWNDRLRRRPNADSQAKSVLFDCGSITDVNFLRFQDMSSAVCHVELE